MDPTQLGQRKVEFLQRIGAGRLLAGRAGAGARRTLGKVMQSVQLDKSELLGLEAIVLNYGRPPIAVRDGSFEPPEGPWSDLGEFRGVIERALPSVGRIDVSGPPSSPTVGTGFLVGPDLVLTTRQVATIFSEGLGQRGLRFGSGCSASIDFAAEEPGVERRCPITAIEMIHPVLDIALLRVEAGPDVPPLPLSSVAIEQPEDRRVVTIAVAAFDFTPGPTVTSILSDRIPRKRILPGLLIGYQSIPVYQKTLWTLTHDCLTTSECVGAPVIDLVTGHVVAIHVAGRPLEEGHAIAASELAHDARLVDSGVMFEEAVDPSTNAWREEWEAADGPATDPSQASPPPRVSVERSSINRLDREVRDKFPSIEDFVHSLRAIGGEYDDVVNAVPRRGSDDSYRKALLKALDRRNLLDQHFRDRILDEAAVRAVEVERPAPAESAQSFGVTAAEPTPAPAFDGAGAWLPPEVLDPLVKALESADVDMELIAFGTPWREHMLLPNGQAQDVAPLTERLATTPDPAARDALIWLLTKLLGGLLSRDPKHLDPLVSSLEYLTHTKAARGATLDPVVPAPSDSFDIAFLTDGIEASRAVGLLLTSDDGGTPAGGTCWLISRSLVVAPSHILHPHIRVLPSHLFHEHGRKEAEPLGVGPVSGLSVLFDFDDALAQTRTVQITAIEMADDELDLAVFRLAEPLEDREPLTINPRFAASGMVTAIHHPRLGPKRISMHGGRILETDGHQMIYLLATEPGSAGAPIFDSDWRVVATHRGRQPYAVSTLPEPITAKIGTVAAALVDRLRSSRAERQEVWREVVAAQPALKTIDPGLDAAFLELEAGGERASIPLIIEVAGDPDSLRVVDGFSIRSTTGNVVTGLGTREAVDQLRRHPHVLSIEASRASGTAECARTIPHIGAQTIHQQWQETGDAALVAVIDSGIDIFHKAFLGPDGQSRIVAFWDQKGQVGPSGAAGTPSAAVAISDAGRKLAADFQLTYGAVYARSDIQAILADPLLQPPTLADVASMEHGTAVCSILAGRRTGDAETDFPGGVAPDALLIVVRYDLRGKSVGYSDGHIDALKFIDGLASQLDKPVVVNISNGMNAGAHDGTSAVEKCCDTFTGLGQTPGRIIVKSAGNERGKGRHARLKVAQGAVGELRWRSLPVVLGDIAVPEIVELWFNRLNSYAFRLRSPGKQWSPQISPAHPSLEEFLLNGNAVIAKYAQYNTQNGDGSLRLIIAPGEHPSVESGEWMLEVIGERVRNTVPIDAWVEETLNREVYFLDNLEDEVTVTIPGTADHVITVGAVAVGAQMRPFERSSSGPTRNGKEKPDIVAPGVGVRAACRGINSSIDAPAPGRSGTSVAAPHVAGVVALALSARAKRRMEGRPQLNTNEIRSALVDTAKHFSQWHEITGYGELDAAALFLKLKDL